MPASSRKPLLSVVAPEAPASLTQTQAELLRGVLRGDPGADAALYETLYPIVAHALQKVLHQPPDYEDLVQAAFERIVRSLQKPSALEIENLGAWASAIAVRVALDGLRARIRERAVFNRDAGSADIAQAVPEREFEPQVNARRELNWLQGELAAMNPEQAEALMLHHVLGLELPEIASLTHVSESAAQKRLSRGHLELKRRAEKRAKGRVR